MRGTLITITSQHEKKYKGAVKLSIKYFGLILVALSIASCQSYGHRRVPNDSFNYNDAIGRASNEQMLLNLVRLRHFDVPVFLSISSVLTQYVYGGELGAEVETANSGGSNADSAGIDGRVIYIERPTITYTPLTGQEFADQLLTPLSRETMFSLAQSGWPAEQLLIMGIERLGPFKNLTLDTSQPENEHQLTEFLGVLDLLLFLSHKNAIEFRETNNDSDHELQGLVLFFNEDLNDELKDKSYQLKQKLRLESEINQFHIVNKVTSQKPNELLIRTRSMLDLMSHLARGIDIGYQDAHADHAIYENEALRSKLIPLSILQSAEIPSDAFVSVRYNNNWYFIDQSDARSKQAFGMLTYIYLLQAPKPPTAGPLVTVPTS